MILTAKQQKQVINTLLTNQKVWNNVNQQGLSHTIQTTTQAISIAVQKTVSISCIW